VYSRRPAKEQHQQPHRPLCILTIMGLRLYLLCMLSFPNVVQLLGHNHLDLYLLFALHSAGVTSNVNYLWTKQFRQSSVQCFFMEHCSSCISESSIRQSSRVL
jgi:hypothetical protein